MTKENIQRFKWFGITAAFFLILIILFVSKNHAFVSKKISTSKYFNKKLLEIPVKDIQNQIAPLNLKKLIARHLKIVIHTVKMHENYWNIAKHYHINVDTVLGANPNMPFVAQVNEKLIILPHTGILCRVQKNQTLSSIAKMYKVSPSIIEKDNKISWLWGLQAGEVIYIPNVKPIVMNSHWRSYFAKRGFFAFPLGDWLRGCSSPFGWRHDPFTGKREFHTGMDFPAPYGSPVYSAAPGRIIFTGPAGGYGNLIVMNNGRGYDTYYAHLSKFLVHVGERVGRGAMIGRVGMTGISTGPHLHFEIRYHNVPINPLPLL
jgi:LysM repeat protein